MTSVVITLYLFSTFLSAWMVHPQEVVSTTDSFSSFHSTQNGLLPVSASVIPQGCDCDEETIPEFEDGESVGTLTRGDPLDEASGLAASRQNEHVLWTHEDDSSPYIYAINTDGTVLGRYRVGSGGKDVEDIAIGPGPIEGVDYLYVGHIGDNEGWDANIWVRRVPEPIVDPEQEYVQVTLSNVDQITMVYPDGAKDAETLMIDTNNDIYIVSKRMYPNKVYRAAYPQSTSETITLELVATLPTGTGLNWITAGDISASGRWIIVRNDQGTDYANIWYRSPGTQLADAFSTSRTLLNIENEPQGESIAFDSDGCGFYTVSEHHHTTEPIWFYERVIEPENTPPVVIDIPDQSIDEGESFTTIHLDDYVIDAEDPDEDISWTASGNSELAVEIVDRTATISIPDPDWYGQETILFTASDTGGLSDADEATFIVSAVNDPPVVEDIPDQTIEMGESFAVISLDEYVTDDEDVAQEITWAISGVDDLIIDFDDGVVTITPRSEDWSGSNTALFTATDSGGLQDSDEATFTITALPEEEEENHPVVFSLLSPVNQTTGVSLDLSQLVITIEDPEGDCFNWSIQTNPYIGNASGELEHNGSKICAISGLQYETTYYWNVHALDSGSRNWTNHTYCFTTKANDNPGGGSGSGPPSGGNPGGNPQVPPENQSSEITILADAGGPYKSHQFEVNTFNGSKSSISNGSIDYYYWTFGDGASTEGKIVTHSYNESGIFNVTLTVVGSEGHNDTDSTYITVKPNEKPSKPIISHSLIGITMTTYSFTMYSFDSDGDQIRYRIDWDDGSIVTTDYVESGEKLGVNHSWLKSGIYDISVVAEDSHGAKSTAATLRVFIDVKPRKIHKAINGFLLDFDVDEVYDLFYNVKTKLFTKIRQNQQSSYLIDDNDDGNWDFAYNVYTDELLSYDEVQQPNSMNPLILPLFGFVFFGVIVVVLLIRKKYF